MGELFPYEVKRALREAGEKMLPPMEAVPIIKIFNAYGPGIWLITESDPYHDDYLYGLADLGRGRPNSGWLSMDTFENAYVQRGSYHLPLERDPDFQAKYSLSIYARAARAAGMITENEEALANACDWKKNPGQES